MAFSARERKLEAVVGLHYLALLLSNQLAWGLGSLKERDRM